jgi:hypothetical protein
MSHTMTMTVENKSGQVLSAYSVSHDWDDNLNSVAGTNLANGASSDPVTITTGYSDPDKYKVDVTYADGTSLSTNFSCDSSQDQTSIVMEINSGDCNCVYYKGSGVDTGCYNKG